MDIPLWLKIGYTLMIISVVPFYWKYWGPKNFLWFSDISLFGIGIALWLENNLIASIMTVITVVVEVGWLFDFVYHLLIGKSALGLTRYMRDTKIPLFIRILSLFHIPLLIIMVYIIIQHGYDAKALLYAIFIATAAFIATYLTKPVENINWVYGLGNLGRFGLSPVQYLISLIIAYNVFIILPTHLLLLWIN